MATHITEVDDVKKTVTSRLLQTDGTTSNGTVETIVQSAGDGAARTFRMTTRDSGVAPADGPALAELIEYASDMAAHWTKVLEKLEAIAGAQGSGE